MADDRNSVSMKLKIAFSGTKYFNAFLCWVSIYDFKYMNLKILEFKVIFCLFSVFGVLAGCCVFFVFTFLYQNYHAGYNNS